MHLIIKNFLYVRFYTDKYVLVNEKNIKKYNHYFFLHKKEVTYNSVMW